MNRPRGRRRHDPQLRLGYQ